MTNSSKISRRFVVGQFWAEHQRCFRNLITAFKVPTLIREIEAALGEKQSVVVSITGTGEAQTKKRINRAIDEEEAIDDLDFSPRETRSLTEYIFTKIGTLASLLPCVKRWRTPTPKPASVIK